MRHVMLDLETWGTKPGSALRSIGAVAFELDGPIGESFYRNIDDQSCFVVGLNVDRSTQEWWMKQSAEAQAALTADPVALPLVAEEFHRWFQDQDAEYVWSQGGNFDEPLWCAAAAAVNSRPPWKFWNTRCTRTIYHVAGFDPRSLGRNGVHHSALDDARFQIECVQESYKRIRP